MGSCVVLKAKMTKRMKQIIPMIAVAVVLLCHQSMAQQDTQVETDNYTISTLLKPGKLSAGGYGALTNKFTTIDGRFANLAGVYGGVYLNHSLLLGVSAAALTNDLRVPIEHRADPLMNLSYMYGQFGGIGEYALFSDRAVHLTVSMFAGAGFTMQYERYDWDDDRDFEWDDSGRDQDWFFVAEPGVAVEFNILKWMRFTPGVSYRAAFNSDGLGLGNSALSNISYNATLKFGKF